MARPEKHEHEKRTERFQFRVTIAEREHVLEQAAKFGIKPADYARNRTVGHRVETPARTKFDPALVSLVNQTNLELKAWGNNLNQIARNLNSERRQRISLEDAQDKLNRLIDKAEAVLDKLVECDGS